MIAPPLSAPVYVDHSLWERIVFNLLSNALKFTFEGSVTVTVKEADASVLLQVKDTSEGIPEKELPKLFERFYRVEGARSRTHEGSGIGLAFVRELVRLHAGTIAAESKDGAGTTLTVSLPKGVAHLPAAKIVHEQKNGYQPVQPDVFINESMQWLRPSGSEQTNEVDEHEDTDLSAASILVVDDNADMRCGITSPGYWAHRGDGDCKPQMTEWKRWKG